MATHSSGLLLFRGRGARLEVLLVHMGGPFWARRDAGAWSLPKGESEPGEDALGAARREFAEELGSQPPRGHAIDLGAVKQAGGKVVRAWALEGELDAASIRSSSFEMEWPRGSGRRRSFPEVDRAAWFDLSTAREKLLRGQLPFLERLRGHLADARRARVDAGGTGGGGDAGGGDGGRRRARRAQLSSSSEECS
jgi:predicted NUDIX family NTP pyrophosphohydrolase